MGYLKPHKLVIIANMHDSDQEKEKPDVSARLDEKDLPKPGAAFHPGQDEPKKQSEEKALDKTVGTDHHESDIKEVQGFAQEQNEQTEEEEKPKNGFAHGIWEIVKTLLIAAAVVLIINTFLFQAYYVSGNSMNPDFHDGDYLLINKIPESWRNIEKLFGAKPALDVKHGDVIIFRPPESPQLFFIKRIIGLPGDRVVLKDGKFTVYDKDHPNGQQIDDSAFTDPAYKTEGEVDTVVEPGKLFVVGDNRSPGGSYDSRAWGQLPEDNVSGVAFFRLIPLNTIGFIMNPFNK